MRTKLALWVLGLSVLALLVGCDGGGDNLDELTVANLQGTYDLDIASSMLGDNIDEDLDVVSGTLEVVSTMATFALTGAQTRTFVIADATTITVTDDNGDVTNSQATLTNNGATLTLLSSGDTLVLERRGGAGTGTDLTIANLQGTYDLEVASSSPLDIGDVDFVVTSAVLDVMATTLSFTATGTNTVTYAIANSTTVAITEADGDRVDFRVTLSNDTMSLRVIEDDGDTFLFDKR